MLYLDWVINMTTNIFYNLSHAEIVEDPIVKIYHDLLSNQIRTLPRGTWTNDRNVVVLIRYVLEIKLELSKDEIPKITRYVIQENKLWGALNRFKSLRKLIHFVYPNMYHECDFNRVTIDYWSDIGRVKERFEWRLTQDGLSLIDVPTFVNYDLLIKWGFSNPLKRHGDSPFQLLNAMYPNQFQATDFKKVPHHYRKDNAVLKKQFFEMLKKEQIDLKDVPEKVNRDMLVQYRFGGIITSYSNSVSKLITSLFPDYFSIEDFPMKPNGYWEDLSNARKAIRKLIEAADLPEQQIPKFLTKKKLIKENLGGLLDKFNGSPIEIINAVYPGKFSILEFPRVPNKYWYNKMNRVQAMRNYCEVQKLHRDEIPLLNRAYFRKHFPRFISVADRHYDSKFYNWIIESFPEHQFHPQEFKLLMGNDGQICDSKEEVVIHNFLCEIIPNAKVERESERFFNETYNETYIPDWIIQQNGRTYIIEYFGLYGSNLYKGYDEKTERKIAFYSLQRDYIFVAIFPEDFKGEGFSRLERILSEMGMEI